MTNRTDLVGVGRRNLRLCAAGTVALFGLGRGYSALAEPQTQTTTFAVMRDDTQIGTNTIKVVHSGPDTTVENATHIEVKLGFLTVYQFEQKVTEHWSGDKLLAMDSTTNDNGTLHKADATNANGALLVKGDGHTCALAADTLPFSPWNSVLLGQSRALDPRDGNLVNVSVSDRGEETLLLHGHAAHAHHYVIKSTYSQDVWYDDSTRLVQVEFKGSDGSTILYKLV